MAKINLKETLNALVKESDNLSEAKAGNTRIENMQFSSTVTNSMTLTFIGWLNKEAYISLVFQTVAVGNDFKLWSLPIH